VPENSLSFLKAVQDATDDKGAQIRQSAFQKHYAGAPVPPDILEKLQTTSAADFEKLLPKKIDSGVREAAIQNFEKMKASGVIPPVLTEPEWWLDPGGKIAAHIATYQKPFDDVMAKVKELFPDEKVTGRLKTVASTRRDVGHKHSLGMTQFTAENLPDFAGVRLVVKGGVAGEKAALEKIREAYGDKLWAESALGLPDVGARVNRPAADEGYRAIHLNVKQDGKNVEIQIRTPRQDFHGEYMHNVFANPDLKHDKAFFDYANKMGEHYYKLDSGLPSTPPSIPWQVKYHPNGALPIDPEVSTAPPPKPQSQPAKPQGQGQSGQTQHGVWEYKPKPQGSPQGSKNWYTGKPNTPAAGSAEAPKTYNIPGSENWGKTKKELEMTIRDSRVAALLAKLEPPVAEKTMDVEVAQLAKGLPVPVKSDDPHNTHLARHLNDKGTMLVKVLRGSEDPAKLANLEAHILAHRNALKG
jgi:ppGpp synthetase/RelA/SpoT-type nucleotidyltranferase